MSVRVNDKLPTFKRNLYNALNDALADGSKDILIKAKTRAPYKKGALRANSETRQQKVLSWRTSFWIEYARFQEFGGDNKRRVQNYSTPGTGKEYLKKSGDEVAESLVMTLKKHTQRARA
jgi:hypothetical protein